MTTLSTCTTLQEKNNARNSIKSFCIWTCTPIINQKTGPPQDQTACAITFNYIGFGSTNDNKLSRYGPWAVVWRISFIQGQTQIFCKVGQAWTMILVQIMMHTMGCSIKNIINSLPDIQYDCTYLALIFLTMYTLHPILYKTIYDLIT